MITKIKVLNNHLKPTTNNLIGCSENVANWIYFEYLLFSLEFTLFPTGCSENIIVRSLYLHRFSQYILAITSSLLCKYSLSSVQLETRENLSHSFRRYCTSGQFNLCTYIVTSEYSPSYRKGHILHAHER